jgi:hypothetical protein
MYIVAGEGREVQCVRSADYEGARLRLKVVVDALSINCLD